MNDPYAVTRLQQEIAALKQEIRAIKGKDDEDTERNLSIRIEEPVENGREERTLPQPESKPVPRSPRPQLGKRSVTCHTAKELGVNTGRKRRRSSSFSGPYLQRRSLDLGSLFSELADPLLVLKAENRELQRKLQEAKISETGKIVKVLSENAQLHKKIDELNVKNSPSDEAEKVSRLVKENAELKRQLGEVSILNSAWCDVTPRLTRKQNEERKISKNLREVGAASCLRLISTSNVYMMCIKGVTNWESSGNNNNKILYLKQGNSFSNYKNKMTVINSYVKNSRNTHTSR